MFVCIKKLSDKKYSGFTPVFVLLTIFVGILSFPEQAFCAKKSVKIGVLANSGVEASLKMWSATADYLNAGIEDYFFSIVPLTFDKIGAAVGRAEVDFVITNPSSFIELEALYGISRIATIKKKGSGKGHTAFGGVIFCRAHRDDINDLKDLKGKALMAVDETSLGGWHAAWRELKDVGLDPRRDFSSLSFGYTHEAVADAVRTGTVDAGTVRTGTLERLAEDRRIDLHYFRILHNRQTREFPFALSTRLYPEWPIAKLKNSDDELAQRVVIELLRMRPDDPAAVAGQMVGWTIPLDYQPVQELMRELHIGPYKSYGKITLASAVRQYWYWLVLGAIVTLFMTFSTIYLIRLNRRLGAANKKLGDAISEHERIEAELLETNSRLQTLIQAIPDVVFFKDEQKRYLLLNKAAEEFMGISQGEAVGKTNEELLPPDLAAYCRKSDEEVVKALTALRFEEQYTRPEGEKGSLETIKAPIFDGNGNVAGLIGISRDISMRKQAENALREAGAALERQLRFTETLLKAVPMAVFYKDAEGHYMGCNEEFSKIMGVRSEEIAGKTVFDLWPTEQARVYHQRDLELLQKPAHQVYEFQVTSYKGEILDVIYSKDVFVDETGCVRGIIGSFLDITERKRSEDALRALNATLEQRVIEETEKSLEKERLLLQQSKMATMGEMIGAIAHQWRQPLNVVGLIVQNMQDAHSDGRLNAVTMDKMVRKSMTQIEHMSKTIDDFRNFMKPDRDKSVFDTMRAAGTVLGLLSAQLSANDITCQLSCRTHGRTFAPPEETSVCEEKTVLGYKNEFEHVILNLISNSRDAILEKRQRSDMERSEKGSIFIDFFNADGNVNIEVSDNGGGIRAEDLDRIFEPYFTTKEPTKGTGLGLYMSKVIVEDHMGGLLTAKNSDRGAIFSIVLPRLNRGVVL